MQQSPGGAECGIQFPTDRVAALQELARVCKPNGHIVAGLFGSPDKVAYYNIAKAVRSTLPYPPAGKGPFALSEPGKLEELFVEAGLNIASRGDVNCPMSFVSLESYWRAIRSAAPLQAALQVVGEEQLKAAVTEVAKPFLSDDGQVLLQPNSFIYVVASL